MVDVETLERLLRAAWREVADLRAALGLNPDFNTVPSDIARVASRQGSSASAAHERNGADRSRGEG